MGGWFSSEPEPTPYVNRTPSYTTRETTSYEYRTPSYVRSTPTQYTYSTPKPRATYSEEIRPKEQQWIAPTVIHNLQIHFLSIFDNILEDIMQYSNEYNKIFRLFKQSKKRYAQIERICKVKNSFLEEALIVRKAEMYTTYGVNPTENLYFHGTKISNINNICKYNFDWRKSGSNYGHKFGKGLSFTPHSEYASHYGDLDSNYRCMVVANVLVGQKTIGTNNMLIPPKGYDTTIKPNGDVIVKYEDNEYCPKYVIFYSAMIN